MLHISLIIKLNLIINESGQVGMEVLISIGDTSCLFPWLIWAAFRAGDDLRSCVDDFEHLAFKAVRIILKKLQFLLLSQLWRTAA